MLLQENENKITDSTRSKESRIRERPRETETERDRAVVKSFFRLKWQGNDLRQDDRTVAGKWPDGEETNVERGEERGSGKRERVDESFHL